MHRYLLNIAGRIIDIRKEERTKTILMFLYFFLTITAYYIIKPVRSSLFLQHLGAENLPFVYIGTALIIGFVVSIYSWFVDRIAKNVLMNSVIIILMSNLILFWWLFKLDVRWMAGLFYIWSAVFSIVVVTQFWTLVNDIFRFGEAKRLFGFIGSGGILGGITGGIITNRCVSFMGTENLLLLSAVILGLCIFIINFVWQREKHRLADEKTWRKTLKAHKKFTTDNVITIILKSKYLKLLVILVGITKLVSTLVDYQFNSIVEGALIDKDAKTAFFGGFFIWLNSASFITQFFITSFVLRRFGIISALLLLPCGLMAGFLSILFNPLLWSAAVTKLYDGSLNYSINQSGKEMLYLPMMRNIRYKVKPFIDMVTYRFSKGVGGVIILVFASLPMWNNRFFSVIATGFIIVWILTILKIRRQYVSTIRNTLMASTENIVDMPDYTMIGQGKSFSDNIQLKRINSLTKKNRQATFRYVKSMLDHNRDIYPQMARLITQALCDNKDINYIKMKLEPIIGIIEKNNKIKEKNIEINRENLRNFLSKVLRQNWLESKEISRSITNDIGSEVVEILEDYINSEDDELISSRAAKLISYLNTGKEIKILITSIKGKNPFLRYHIIKSLNRIKLRDRYGVSCFKNEIVEFIKDEVNFYMEKADLLYFYCANEHEGKIAKDDFLTEILLRLMEEDKERIFRLLGLLYRPVNMAIIYNRLLEDEEYIKADAVELFDNIVERKIRNILAPVIDNILGLCDERVKDIYFTNKRKKLHSLFEKGLSEKDRWLSMCVITIIYKLKIEELYDQIRNLTCSKDVFVAQSANVILEMINNNKSQLTPFH